MVFFIYDSDFIIKGFYNAGIAKAISSDMESEDQFLDLDHGDNLI